MDYLAMNKSLLYDFDVKPKDELAKSEVKEMVESLVLGIVNDFESLKDLRRKKETSQNLRQKKGRRAYIDMVNERMKPYQCSVCQAKFVGKCDLKRHIECVHECKTPYECWVCLAKFEEKGDMEKHIGTIHEENM